MFYEIAFKIPMTINTIPSNLNDIYSQKFKLLLYFKIVITTNLYTNKEFNYLLFISK